MKRKHIVVCVSLILVLSVFIFLISQGTGIQRNNESKYLPQSQGEALWQTEKGDSWFKVEEGAHPTGEITIGGKTSKAYFVFAGTKDASVTLYEGEFFGEAEDVDIIAEYYGNCEFSKNKVLINLKIAEETVAMIFEKQ